tara:strand:+ start:72 stop:533 length:462 start_codon:yes stop_codon:yes gene_type:complete
MDQHQSNDTILAKGTISKRTDFLNSILLGALDYADYWANVTNYTSDLEFAYIGAARMQFNNGQWSSYKPYEGMYYGVSADVKDVEGDMPAEWIHVDENTIAKGIEIILTGKHIQPGMTAAVFQANIESDAGLVDGPLADCILQAGVLGEVVYG